MNQRVINKLEEIKKAYETSDVCMGELLEDLSADGLSIDDAFYVYMIALEYAEGDTFYRKLGGYDDIEKIDLL